MNSPATAPPAHLLIVDDTPTNIEILLGMLEDDYDLSFATSGRQVLDLLGKGLSTPGQGSTFWFSVRLRAGVGPTAGTNDSGPIDWTRVGAAIAVLEGLLADSDCAALTLWTDSRPLLVPVLRDRLETFEAAITGFDLESAHRLLSEAVGATPELASNSQSHNIP